MMPFKYNSYLIYIVSMYISFLNFIMRILPKYIIVASYNHITTFEYFKIDKYIYYCNRNNKFYNLKIIDNFIFDKDNIIKNKNLINRNLINHSCIISNNGEYMRDITEDIRMFIHYNKLIKWKYIIIHLNISNSILVLHLNNNNLDEIQFNTNDLIQNNTDFCIN